MKKYLSFLLLGMFLLFSSFFVPSIETKAVDNTDLLNTNITVSSSVDAVFNADGTNTIGNFEIHNNMLIPIEVDNVTLTGKNGWKVVDENITIPVDSKNFSIAILNTNLKEGINNINIPVPEGTKKSLDIGIRRGAYSTDRTLEESLDMTIDYSFKTKVFHATFDTDGGTAVASIDAINGSTFVIPETSKDYYKFLGWKNMTDLSDEKLYQAGENFVMPIGDVQFKAQYQKNTITFRYHSNGGTRYNSDGTSIDTPDIIATETFDFDNQSGAAGLSSFYEQTALYMKKTGYHYPDLSKEWIVNSADSQIYQAGSGVTKYLDVAILAGKDAQLKKGNVTIEMYANWIPNTYTVRFAGNYNTSGAIADIQAKYDEIFILPRTGVYKDGYKLEKWNSNKFGTGTDYMLGSEIKNLTSLDNVLVTLYAQWTPTTQQVVVDPNNGEEQYVLSGTIGERKKIKIPERTGYIFDGWEVTTDDAVIGTDVSTSTDFNTLDNPNLGVYKANFADSEKYGSLELEPSASDNPTGYKYQAKITATSSYVIENEWNRWYTYVGFYNISDTSIENTWYIHEFKAKIPKGIRLQLGANSRGEGGSLQWLTSSYGTGEWETYAYKAYIGTSPHPSAIGYVYIQEIDDNLLQVPFSWELGESKHIRMTDGSDTTIPQDNVVISKQNYQIKAKWKPISYTIKLNANGGVLQSGKLDTITAKYDETITLPNDAFLFGFSSPGNFGGYNTKPDGTGTLYSWDNLSVKNLTDVDGETINLYVNWIPTIDFNSIYRYRQQGINFANGENVKNFDVVVTKANGETTEYAMTNGDWGRGGFEAGDTVEIKWIDYRPGYEFYNFALCYGTGDESAVGTDGVTIINQDEKSIKFKFNKTYVDGKSLIRIKWLNDATTYSINYDLDGGSLPTGQSNPTTYTTRKESFTLNNPTKTGYTFAGWEEVLEPSKWTPGDISRRLYESTREAYYSDFISIKAGETYTFSNENQEYGLRYYDKNFEYLDVLNGKGDGYTAPQDGYVRFVAPYYMTNKDKINQLSKMKNASVNQNVTIEKGSSGNRTYVAKWVPTEYTINYINTFNGDNKGSASRWFWALGTLHSSTAYNYTVEDSVTLPIPEGKIYGKTFAGWYTNPDFTGDAVTSIPKGSIGDKTFYAKWNYQNYNLTIDLNGGTIDGLSGIQTYTGEYDTTFSFNEATPTKDGYTFKGWGTKKGEPLAYDFSTITKVSKSSDNPSPYPNEYQIVSGEYHPEYKDVSILAQPIGVAKGMNLHIKFYAKFSVGSKVKFTGNFNIPVIKWTSPSQDNGTGEWELYECDILYNNTGGYHGNMGYVRLVTNEKTTVYVSDIDIYITNPNAKFKFGAFVGSDSEYKAIWEKNT